MTKSETTWLDGVLVPPPHESLKGDISTEIVVVGGGVTGTIVGYLLAKNGKKVVILDKKNVSRNVTVHTTGWLSCILDTNLNDLVKMYDSEGAKKIWRSGMDSINLVESIINEEKIDCDFKRVSYYQYADSKKDLEILKKENLKAEELGFNTNICNKESLPFQNLGSLEVELQAKFHPIKFLIGLRQAAEKYGVAVYENTEVLDMVGDKSIITKTENGSVTADYFVMATHQPFKDLKELFAHKATYLSYVLEIEIPKNIIAEGLYEDTKNPYHYFRVDMGEDKDRVILGGEDHRREIPIYPEKNFGALEMYFKKLFPNIKYEIVRKWMGPIVETIDGLPYIGQYSKAYPNRFVATGFSGNGITYAVIAGQIITDKILNKQNDYSDLYYAGRNTRLYHLMKKAIYFTFEFFGGAARNFFR